MRIFRRGTLLEPLVDEYCEVLRLRSRGTAKSWRTDQNRLRAAVELLGVKHVEEIGPSTIAAVLNAKEADGCSPKSVNAYREILCRFLNYTSKDRGIEFCETGRTNPVSFVRRRREPAPRIVFLELHEQEVLLEGLSSHPQLRAMVAMLIFAGLRRAEALWLAENDVDLDRRLIHVGAKSVAGRQWQPKTGRNRSVPISQRLLDELARWRSPSDSVWFFPSPGGRRWHEDNFSKALKRAQEPLGTNWTCLHFRHTFGSMLARKGVSLYKIATLLGNSPEICRRHYAHLRAEDLIGEVDF